MLAAMATSPEASDIALDRAGLVSQMSRLLSDWGAGDAPDLYSLIDACTSDYGEAGFEAFLQRARKTGATWGFHPSDPLARSVSRAIMGRVVLDGSALDDAGRLDVARERPAVFLGNHLSFVDVNVLDYLMADAGYGDVSSILTTLVGPKVYTHPVRRLASMTFGTIKMPQSTSRASGEAVMSAREVAKIARGIFAAADDRLRAGEHLLVFPEGSRSRDGAMQPCLAAVARYLGHADAVVVPFGLAGCEKLVPLEEDHAHPCIVRGRIGVPVPAAKLLERAGGRRERAMHIVGYLIADTLPVEYRGAYDRDASAGDPRLDEARDLADELSGQ
jgi:1-acyl-sn-glycerol-3-phosphate acyltransferase